jgi:hypothetical protein
VRPVAGQFRCYIKAPSNLLLIHAVIAIPGEAAVLETADQKMEVVVKEQCF